MEQYMKPIMEIIVLSGDIISASCPEDYMHPGCCGGGLTNYAIETPPLP